MFVRKSSQMCHKALLCWSMYKLCITKLLTSALSCINLGVSGYYSYNTSRANIKFVTPQTLWVNIDHSIFMLLQLDIFWKLIFFTFYIMGEGSYTYSLLKSERGLTPIRAALVVAEKGHQHHFLDEPYMIQMKLLYKHNFFGYGMGFPSPSIMKNKCFWEASHNHQQLELLFIG